MPIRGSPNGARHPHPQAGRDRPEPMVAINRNAWSKSIGIDGRDRSVRALKTSWDRFQGRSGSSQRAQGSKEMKHAISPLCFQYS
jgi:hypothetical protein